MQRGWLLQDKYKQNKHQWCKKHILIPLVPGRKKQQWFSQGLRITYILRYRLTIRIATCPISNGASACVCFRNCMKTYRNLKLRKHSAGVPIPTTPQHWKHPFLFLNYYLSSSCLWTLSWSSRSLCSRARRRFSAKILAASSAVVVPATVLLLDSAKVKRNCCQKKSQKHTVKTLSLWDEIFLLATSLIFSISAHHSASISRYLKAHKSQKES